MKSRRCLAMLQAAIVCLVVLAGQPGLVQQPTAQARNAPAAVLAQAPTVSARPSSVPAGGTIGATWTGIASPNSNDRIGVYQGNTDLNLWVYTDGRSAGQAAIPLPATLPPASNYALRLYAAGGGLLATSPPFAVTAAVSGTPSSGPSVSARPDSVPVGGTVSATWTGIASPNVNDRVEVYAGPNSVNLRVYTDGRASGQAAISLAGLGEGSYNLRLLDGSGTLLTTSAPFRIGAPPTPLPTSTATPSSCVPVEAPPAGTASNPPYINGGSVGGVHTLTGSYSYSHTDVAIAGVGPVPSFTRTYNANDSRSGSLGVGWTHNYAIRLVRPASSSNDIVLVGPQGRSDYYTYTGDPNGFWSPPPGVFTTLQKQTNGTFEAKALDQSRMTFNACGRLDAIIDRYGNRSDLTYDPVTGRLALIADPAGRGSLSLGYDANGRLTSVQDWSGRPAVTYEYDASGRLSKVHDRMTVPAGGNVTTFGYDAGSRLSTITDARTTSPCPSTGCVVLTNTYYPSGQVHYQDDAAGQRTTFTYRTSPPGADVTFPTPSYPAPPTPVPPTPTPLPFHPTQADSYDGNGWLTTEVTRPENGISYTVSHAYDATKGVRTSTTDARGATTTYCYDVSTAGTALGTRGLLTRVIAPSVFSSDIGANTQPTTLTEYDGLNRPTRVYSPKGVNTVAIPPTCTADYTVPNALDLAYATDNAYSGHNELTAVTRRYYSYDQNGNRTGAMQVATTKYEYSSTWPGQVTYETPPRGNPGPQPDHAYATAHTYYGPGDPQAGLRATTQPPAQTAVYMCYDAVGRLTAKSDGFVNACDSFLNQNHRWDYTYDNEDRLLSTTSPPTTFGQANTRLTTSSSYDAVGHRLSSTDASGNITRFSYDARGQLAEVRQSKNYADPDSDNNPLVTQYTYDNLGHRQWVFKLLGTTQVRSAQYLTDGLGRLRQEIEYPGSGSPTRTYSYDANGNGVAQDNPNGGHIASTYDALNRLTGITYSGGNSTPSVTYQYDRGGRRTRMTTSGQGDSVYTYDERAALVRVETPYVGSSGVTKVVRYGYDPDGNRAWLRYPPRSGQTEGDQLTYGRDTAGRVQTVTDWLSRSTTFIYAVQDSRLTQQQNVNLTKQTRSYDNLRRLTQVDNVYSTNAVITSDTHTLDANGNPLTINRAEQNACSPLPCSPSLVSFAETYSYDRLNRLTSFTDPDPWTPATISQSYDAAQNMATVNYGPAWTNTLDGADRLIQAQTVATPTTTNTYGYDNNGNNLTASGPGIAYTFTYDVADRPTQVTANGQTVNLSYDGDGVRVRKAVGSVTSQYVYDRAGKVPVLLEDGNRRYVPGPTGVLYATSLDGVGAPQVIYHTDQQGSVRALTNASAQLVYSTRYEPYGLARHTASASAYAGQPLGYTGAPFDPEASLVYLHARYYAPSVFRFIQRDSVFGSDTDPVSLNRYAYARNNPMVFTDPTGHQAFGPEGYNPLGCFPSPSCWSTPAGLEATLSPENPHIQNIAIQAQLAGAPIILPVLGAIIPALEVIGDVGDWPSIGPTATRAWANAVGRIAGCWWCGRTDAMRYIADHFPSNGLIWSGFMETQAQWILSHCDRCSNVQSQIVRGLSQAMQQGNYARVASFWYMYRMMSGYFVGTPWDRGREE